MKIIHFRWTRKNNNRGRKIEITSETTKFFRIKKTEENRARQKPARRLVKRVETLGKREVNQLQMLKKKKKKERERICKRNENPSECRME